MIVCWGNGPNLSSLLSTSHPARMWHPLLFFGLLAIFISYVYATALTFKLTHNEKACFFAEVLPAQVNGKIAFYFAVRLVSFIFLLNLKKPPSYILLTLPLPSLHRINALVTSSSIPLTSGVTTGPIRRLLRHRHHRHRAQRQNDPQRAQTAPGRLRLHRPSRRRV